MGQERFTPIAEILVTGYLETLSYSRVFLDQHGSPPTIMSKSHHLRSVVQAEVAQADGLLLGDWYVEFGRVEITDVSTRQRYVLQSASSLAVERIVRQRDGLFDANNYLESEVSMLVYDFGKEGVTLSLAGAINRPPSQRLRASGMPSVIRTWRYDIGRRESFDQDEGRDAFEELGGLGMGEEQA